jgi:CRP/FNR family cyclic AMP-dependent transcriptional regulator
VEPPDEILAELGETRTWEPGTAVVTEGEAADSTYIIHAGELRTVVAGDGGRSVELNTPGPGEFFGELMLSGERRAATAEVTVRARLTRIAERLGASRTMVDRLLQDLARGGYVEVSREHIVLLKKLPPRW